MNRRSFLKALGLTAAVAPIAPQLLLKELSKPMLTEAAPLAASSVINCGSFPKVLWPGIKAFYEEACKDYKLEFTELFE